MTKFNCLDPPFTVRVCVSVSVSVRKSATFVLGTGLSKRISPCTPGVKLS